MSGNGMNGGMSGGTGMPYQGGYNSPGLQNMGMQNMGMNQRMGGMPGGMPMQTGSSMATPMQAQPQQAQMPQAVPPAMGGGQQPMQMGQPGMPQDLMQSQMQGAMRMPNRFNQY